MNIRRTTRTAAIALAGILALSGARRALGQAEEVVMIGNQLTQISNQVRAITEMQQQLAQQVQQYTQLRDQAMGLVGAITTPINELIALPAELLSEARSWAGDFTGDAGDLVDAVTDMGSGTSFRESWQTALDDARTVTAATVRDSYADQPADVAQAAVAAWQDQEAQADERLVLTHVRADAAATLAVTAQSAQAKLDALANDNPVTDTALQQAVLAGNLSQAQILTALAQIEAWDRSEAAAVAYESEIGRRERDAAAAAERIAAAAAVQRQLQAIEAQRANRQRGLELRLHPMYGGN